jgi:imidazole glycerol-phosphate synthase subunit HisH
MSARLVVVDYGMGNLNSVQGAIRYLGVEPIVSSDPSEVKSADMLVLPGVGSFQKAMVRLEETGLADALREAVIGQARKILGICLGQQLMADYGNEDGGHAGLGFFPGTVTRFPRSTGLKVPHVGFNKVRFDPASRLFSGFEEPVDCYFVHSYKLAVDDRPGFSGICDYGEGFLAAYEHENVFATQFHPEKSQTNGLRLLSNFLSE